KGVISYASPFSWFAVRPASVCGPGVDFKLHSLFDVFPVDGVQAPRDPEEQDQEQQHPHTETLALELYGFGHPAQEVGKVGHLAVESRGGLGVDRRERNLVDRAAVVALEHFGGDLREALCVVLGYG